MHRYHKLGKIPRKRHTVFRSKEGNIYHEELKGNKGFDGPSALLYHIHPPTEVISTKVVDNFILEEYYGDSFDSNFKYKFHMQKCVSLLNGALWSMIAEIFSKKVFDYVSYTNKMLKRYEKQFDYYSSLRI